MSSRSARERRAQRRAQMSGLTPEERDELIRQDYAAGRSLTWLGETYGVNHYTVRRIVGAPPPERPRPKPRTQVCCSCGCWALVLNARSGWCAQCTNVFAPECLEAAS